MKLSDEYRLAEYEELKNIHGRDNIFIVRNRINGLIGVKKIVPMELMEIYIFLKNHPTPFIPVIYECIKNDKELIIIEEYLNGQNLEEMLVGQNLSEKEAVFIISQLCDALKPLHNAEPPIICRDLKAANVMITMDKEVKIIDFDIARTYQKGQHCDTEMMGTKEYAAPEQYGFRQTDARTDIYAMGVLLNYIISGKYPVEEIVNGKLGDIIGKCLEMNPDDRYQSVEELKMDLDRIYRISEKEKEPGKQIYGMEETKRTDNSYMIPGFRSHTWWKMLSAILGYAFVTMTAFSIEFKSDDTTLSGIRLRFEQGVIWLTQIALIFLICNYRGIRDDIPLVRDSRKSIRILGYVIAEIVLLFVGILFLAMIESFIF